MYDSILNRFLTHGSTFQEMLPAAVLFMIVWCMVWVAIRQMKALPQRVAVVLSVCITLLALLGFREDQLEWLCQHYAAMAITMLVSLAAAIRVVWKKVITEKKKE